MEYQQFLTVVLTFVMPLLVLQLWSKFQNTPSKKFPPGPKKLPILGNLHQLMGGELPYKTLLNLSKQHGPLMLLQVGSVRTLVISSTKVAREIFKAHDLSFSSRPQLYAAKWLNYAGKGITFAPYGEHWRQVRKIVMLEILSVKRVQSFSSTREKEIGHMIDLIAQSGSNNPVNLSELATTLTNDIICHITFGTKYDNIEGSKGNIKSEAREFLVRLQLLFGMFNVADFFPWAGWLLNKVNGVDLKLATCFGELDAFFEKIIEEHRDIIVENETFVDVLLRLQKDPNQSLALTNTHVKGLLMDMFAAGTFTSSATLTWMMTELIKSPSVLKKAQDEVRQAINGKQRVEESDLHKLSYLKLVIKETLRMHPPTPLLVPKQSFETITFGEYEIPANTRIFVNAMAISRDPQVWENPNKFDPERFVNSSIDFRGQDFELIPFGVGRRSCPGINFATLLIEIAAANLLYCFDWNLPKGMNVDDVNMDEVSGLTMSKKEPLLLLATPRHV